MNQEMHAREAISAAEAECYIVIEGQRYNFMQAINLEATVKKNKKKVPILGRVNKGNKATGQEITGKAQFHYNTSLFRDVMLKYQNKGEDIYFDIIVTNEDPTATVGRQTIILKDCNLDSGLLVKFDADGDTLTDEIEFTVERFEMPEKFKHLEGMVM